MPPISCTPSINWLAYSTDPASAPPCPRSGFRQSTGISVTIRHAPLGPVPGAPAARIELEVLAAVVLAAGQHPHDRVQPGGGDLDQGLPAGDHRLGEVGEPRAPLQRIDHCRLHHPRLPQRTPSRIVQNPDPPNFFNPTPGPAASGIRSPSSRPQTSAARRMRADHWPVRPLLVEPASRY